MAAPDKEKAEEKDEKPPPAPSARGSKLVVILLGLNTALLVAILAVVLLRLVPTARHAPAAAVSGEGGGERATEAAASPPAEKAAEKQSEKTAEKAPDKAKAPTGALPPGPTVRLPEFVVHLRDVDSERYARMAFELEVGTDLDKEKITAHLPRLRDALLAYLSDRTVSDLRGSENIARMKQALLEIVKAQVTNVPTRALYITDLVIQ
jgi:flagellar protein FliL